jgi:hypothetical protein
MADYYITSRSSRKMGLRGVIPKGLVRCRRDRHAREQVVEIMHTKKARGGDAMTVHYPPLDLARS